MKDNRIFSTGIIFIFILALLVACGGRNQKVDTIGGEDAGMDELMNVTNDDSKKGSDDEDDVLKLLGITPAKKDTPEPPPEKKEETKPALSEEDIKKFEDEISEKDDEIKRLTNELHAEKQKLYNLQSQLDAEKAKAVQYQNLKPVGSSYKQRYDDALDDYNRRRYQAAINKFERLLATDRNTSLADNCQYWIGECYYGLGDYTRAIAAFEKVFSFTNSNKSDDAQLKLGLCYLRLNEVSRAREELERLLSHYPKSEYISLAERFLNKL